MEFARLAPITTDRLEQALVEGEATIARVRATQIRLLSEIDARQVPIGDGCRNLAEWVAARLDLAPETAQRLTQTAGRLVDQPGLALELEEGAVSFDRVIEESRLINAGANPELVAQSRGWDLSGVRRTVARHQRISRQDEQRVFDGRFLSIQPSLDQSSYKMWGLFAGTDGRLVERALLERADRFPATPGVQHAPRTQRHADALGYGPGLPPRKPKRDRILCPVSLDFPGRPTCDFSRRRSRWRNRLWTPDRSPHPRADPV